MVYKRYIYRDGKRFGPYYYHTYRDKHGKTHSRYIDNPREHGAVIHAQTHSHLFAQHKTLFILLGIIALFLVSLIVLSNELSKQEGVSSQEQGGFSFKKLANNVKSFVTGLTADTPDAGTSETTTDTTSSDTSPITETPTEEIIPDETTPTIENPIIETPTEEVPVTETPTAETTSEESINETIPETSANETTSETETEETNVTEQVNETAVSNETIVEDDSGGVGGVGIISNNTNQTPSITITEQNITNVTVINSSVNVFTDSSTFQYGAVLGQPVRWEKRVKIDIEGADSVDNLVVDLPELAGNVSVKKIKDEKEEDVESFVKNEKIIEESSPGITGSVTAETEGNGFFSRIFNFILGFFRGSITGKVVEAENNVEVEINSPVFDKEELVLEYYTDAPYAEERKLKDKTKEISIVGPGKIKYENVLAYANLHIEVKDKSDIKLYLIENGQRTQEIDFNAYDKNNNLLLYYIEWVVPLLDTPKVYELEITSEGVTMIERINLLINEKGLKIETKVIDNLILNNKTRVIIKTKQGFSSIGKKIKSTGNYESVELDENLLNLLDNSSIDEIILDQPVDVLLGESEIIIRSLDARNDFGLTGKNKRVCILDTGVDYSHPSITNYKKGQDFVNNDSDPMDDNGHGTSVSGVISRIAPESDIYMAKVMDANGQGYESYVLEGLQWCIDNKADIISFSIGSGSYNGFCYTNVVAELSNMAVEQGIFVVAATGNDGTTALKSPSCASNATRVSSTDKQDAIASFANVNKFVDLFAPGVNVYVPILGGGFASLSGTSISAPMVSAGAALVLENESLNPSELKYVLRSTGNPIKYMIDFVTEINISRLDVYNAIINNVTMLPYNYSGEQGTGNESNFTLLVNGCSDSSCVSGTACCNGGGVTCVVSTGTSYTCLDADTSSASCAKTCDEAGTSAGACQFGFYSARAWLASACCGDDVGEGYASGSDGTNFCCEGSSTADDSFCGSDSGWTYEWQIDGARCLSTVVRDTVGAWNPPNNDMSCGCPGTSTSAWPCDAYNSDTDGLVDGVCTGANQCTGSNVRIRTSDGGYVICSGSLGEQCDTNTAAGTWAVDSICLNSGVCDASDVVKTATPTYVVC